MNLMNDMTANTVHNLKTKIEKKNAIVTDNAENVINAVSQLELKQ